MDAMTQTLTPNAVERLLGMDLASEDRIALETAQYNTNRDYFEVSVSPERYSSMVTALRTAYAAHVASGGAPYAQH